jgi:hypothetical protein
MSFRNLEQRMAQTYLDTFPVFKPREKGSDICKQESFYNLMRNLYRLAGNEPELFVSQVHEDDVYTNRFNKSSEGKPDLQKNMRIFTKSVDDLLEAMFRMGDKQQAVKLNQRQSNILKRLGVNDTGKLPEAWVWMATRPGTNLLTFSRCLFDEVYDYPSGIYAGLLGDKAAFGRLENWLEKHGYRRYQYLDGQMTMDFANPAWDKNPPTGGNQFKIRHTGVSFVYDKWVKEPALMGLCIPGGLKNFLEAFGDMEENEKDFVINQTKKCDACNYCIQTDKSGKRPRALIPVKHHENTHNLCPLFPGVGFGWTSINNELANDIIAMLSFMDSRLGKKKTD